MSNVEKWNVVGDASDYLTISAIIIVDLLCQSLKSRCAALAVVESYDMHGFPLVFHHACRQCHI